MEDMTKAVNMNVASEPTNQERMRPLVPGMVLGKVLGVQEDAIVPAELTSVGREAQCVPGEMRAARNTNRHTCRASDSQCGSPQSSWWSGS
jgi:hypothetical protein